MAVIQQILSSYPSATSDPASALVSGFGTSGVNKEWDYLGLDNGRSAYGTSEDDGVFWNGTIWSISSGGDSQYQSTDDVLEPWLVTTWVAINGDAPIGTVRASTDVWVVTGIGAGSYGFTGYANGYPVFNTTGTVSDKSAISDFDDSGQWQIFNSSNVVVNASVDRPPFPDMAIWVGSTVGSPGQPFTETFTANGTWTCPTGVTSAFIACIGKGGNGFGTAGGGGGGGSYGGGTLVVTPGTPYALTSFPTNAYFSSTVNFIGGNGGTNGTSLTKGVGGTVVTLGASVTGGITNTGGDGANGVVATLGGGGGGAGGSTGAGTNASGATHGNGNAPGGNGGDGAVGTADGSSGTTPGGGGGGALLGAGGTGGTARCQITYIYPS